MVSKDNALGVLLSVIQLLLLVSIYNGWIAKDSFFVGFIVGFSAYHIGIILNKYIYSK
mgnify:CR=1 FL=1|tara:strand:+ start:403 stop:576 length:174 start_codon:yes stop_codon:yes gene_type:complete